MGFKQDFYRHSLRIDSRLVTKLKPVEPDILSTDCFSCRMQFDRMTVYKVLHPLEILKESYNTGPQTSD
jgi:glycerol-3-phosphate dehydrogenase subunit C